jgi:hypothetical protein
LTPLTTKSPQHPIPHLFLHGIRFWGSLVDIFRVGPGSGFPFLLPLIPKFFTMPCSHQGSALVNREVSGPNDLNKKGVKTPIYPFLLPLIPKFVGLRGSSRHSSLYFPSLPLYPPLMDALVGARCWYQMLMSGVGAKCWCQILRKGPVLCGVHLIVAFFQNLA